MKLKDWLKKCNMTGLKINLKFMEMDFEPRDQDKDAAWELYIELLTRIATQPLPSEHGDEKTALDSIYSLFSLTRDIIKRKGRDCLEFAKIAIVVLNQIVRPFTAKWHKLSIEEAFKDSGRREEFRKELKVLQEKLKIYSQMLADMAGVEDLTELEQQDEGD